MIKKITLIVISCLLITTLSFAQEKSRHEFSGYLLGGLSTLKYDVDNGERAGKMGGGIGLGYTYFLSDAFGLGTGLELAFYNASAELVSVYNRYKTVDDFNTPFEYISRVSDYKETQNAMYLNIPITLQYQVPVSSSVKFYAIGGAKIGIPLSSKFKAEKGEISNSGYYEKENKEYFGPDYRERGFDKFSAKNKKEDFDLNVAFTLTLETGLKWSLFNNNLYTGLYFDYGLNDVGKGKRAKNLIEYNAQMPVDYIGNSILDSRYGEGENKSRFVTKVAPMAFGIKLKYSFEL